MVQQAKDEQGLWREIEYWRDDYENAYCSMGDNIIQIVPNSGVMSKTPAFKGNFNTEIRIKLFSEGKLYYSNSIKGQINKGQFQRPQTLMKQKEFEPKQYLLSEKKKNEI
jgi:hypothetical protein